MTGPAQVPAGFLEKTIGSLNIGHGGWTSSSNLEVDAGKGAWLLRDAAVDEMVDQDDIYVQRKDEGYVVLLHEFVLRYWTPDPTIRPHVGTHVPVARFADSMKGERV